MRIMSWLVAMLFCAAFVQAETLEGLSRKIDDIKKGNDTGNQIEDLRVRDDATVGDALTVTGDASVGDDLAVTGDATVGLTLTVTGKTQADDELEANADVDVNLGAATEEVDITQTNTVGQANTPLVKITDARTGANANATNEAALMISAEGTYGLAVTKGAVDVAGALSAGSATVAGLLTQTRQTITATEGDSLITVTANNIAIEGQYGVVTASLAAATSPGGQVIRVLNTVATNVVFVESTGLQLPAGYSAVTNGQWDVTSFMSYGTNWVCTGIQDN